MVVEADPTARRKMPQATSAATVGNAASFSFSAVHRKKVTAAFDGSRITSDGEVLLLAQAERAMGICTQLAGCIADPRDPTRVLHALPDILRARVLAIAGGYDDADDFDALRDDPGFRLTLGKLPETGGGASQPTDDEPLGECVNDARAGRYDARDGRNLLRQLSHRAEGGDARNRRYL
jgi:hypothetical protein